MDVATLGLTVQMLGRMLDLPGGLAVTVPVGGLEVVVLLHASMHHRPALVLLGAGAFVACLLLGAPLPSFAEPARHLHGDAGEHLVHFRLFPVAIFVLAAAILVVTTRRTRRFIEEAYRHASRAATLSRHFAPEVVDELTMRAEESVRFGAPRPHSDDARRVPDCGMAMVAAMEAWSQVRSRNGRAPLSIGIGVHYGHAFAGVLSDGRLLEYRAIGDTVNVASRFADVPRGDRSELVASDVLVCAAGGLPSSPRWERLPSRSLPGHPRMLSPYRFA